MNIEENRLRTFTDWPATAAVDASRIAKAGFYYSGHALEVQCFLCGVKISDWNYGDQAIVRHRLAAPDCPFIENPSATCNVPLIPISTNDTPGLASSSTEILQDNNVAERQSSSRCQNNEPLEECKNLSERLISFINWPISSVVSPEKLARAGFYYLQHDDEVQCVYCGGILRKWEAGDNPDVAHKKYFPNCNFYVHRDKDDNLYLSNVKLMPGATSNLSELGIQTHTTPKNPNYPTYEERLSTFRGWPEDVKQTPEMLASAGFYYDGSGDHVRCFHCDGGLRNWEATDDAWIEHARWFPKCEFVNLIRGQEFIQQCINNRPPLDESIFEGVAEDEGIDAAEVPPAFQSIPLSKYTETAAERLLENIPEPNQASESSYQLELNDVSKKLTNSSVKQNNADRDKCSIEKENSTTVSNEKGNSTDEKTNINFKGTALLEAENRELREARLCKICMDREVAIVFLPCGHLVTCVYCAPSLTYCPMCRQEIKATVRTFLS